MTRLLIVDDSALMRRLLTQIFSAAGDFEIATARDGNEAIGQLTAFAPDVVTLDVHMPGMDGLTVLDRIMVERPCPVVMVSSLTEDGAEETLEAMALGAVDFFPKPRGAVSLAIAEVAPELVETVRGAAKARISRALRLTDKVRFRAGAAEGLARAKAPVRPRRAAPRPVAPRQTGPVADRDETDGSPSPDAVPAERLILIGISTGGPPALDVLLEALPAQFPAAILIAQHMPASFTGPLARRLDRLCALPVSEVTAATPLLAGHVYIGRGDADLIVSKRGGALVVLPAPSSPDHHWHPSADRLVQSAMAHVEPQALTGVLMTGMGADGAKAMTALRQAGGYTIAEAAETAVIWGMPGALVAAGGAAIILPRERIAASLVKRVRQ
ncbi:chemotaxis-specific protein-glutamate methyltransferase CheB [Sphingomonas sp. AP4-R1]|uniref:chemotaxis-specific protein-glutamate methyltransferase CheB n=1 Tax=Sphingomonas sp. AP4-R1 TaxID=2735134 RepID=UPI001493742B|nr:chemotaxis-specific protein-glutamate methyltransferase CheB [Sphingomonas sp. AP4-R1]QJU59366.1 chemotaxis-specific protein-glutamate methyltransferase CheB [Sphingomonas sp. AP4-R1]